MSQVIINLIIYFLISGLYSYWRYSDTDKLLAEWDKRHEGDEDFTQKRQELISYLEMLYTEQSLTGMVCLVFGWLIMPFSIYTQICGDVKRLFKIK